MTSASLHGNHENFIAIFLFLLWWTIFVPNFSIPPLVVAEIDRGDKNIPPPSPEEPQKAQSE